MTNSVYSQFEKISARRKQLQKSVNKGMSVETANERLADLQQAGRDATAAYNFSADSINQANPGILAERKRQREVDAEQKYDKKQSKRK